MAKRGKKYIEAQKKLEAGKFYTPEAALGLIKEISNANFDATVEVHMRMGLDPRQADQQVRATVVLPNGLGKSVSVLVFAEGEAADIAREAGADHVADDKSWVEKIQGGWTGFDVAIAIPQQMGTVGRLGRVLGPRGLMPNPKAGTVVGPDKLAQAIKEAKAGRVEFRLDKNANIHVPIGKVSFETQALLENFQAFMAAIKKARPSAAKGNFIRRITVTSTMSPGLRIDTHAATSAS